MFETMLEKMVVGLGMDATSFDATYKHIEGRINGLQQRFTRMGTWLSLSVTAPLELAKGASIAAFADFDDSMTKSLAIMGNVSQDMKDQMAAAARDIARNSVTSATDAAAGFYYLASAGYDAAASMKNLSVVNSFAVAGAFDMAKATELLADSQSALGMKVADTNQNYLNMKRISDVLVDASNASNASAEQFAMALTNKTAAALRTLNKDLEEGVAVLAVYADQGKKAQVGGEMMTIMLRELQKASNDEAAAWRAAGLSVYDAQGKMLPMVDIIRQLERATAGMSDQRKFQFFKGLGFMSESMQAILPLLGMSDAIEKYEKRFRSAGGATEEVERKQRSFRSELTITKNLITDIAIDVGQILAPAVSRLNDLIRTGNTVWRELNVYVKQAAVYFSFAASVTGPLLLVLSQVVPYLPTIGKNFQMMWGIASKVFMAMRIAAMAAIVPYLPIIGIILAVGAAIGGLLYWLVGPQGLKDAWEATSSFAATAWQKTWTFVRNFGTNVGIFFTWLGKNWRIVLSDMGTAMVTALGNMANNLWVAFKTMMRLEAAFAGWLSVALPALYEYVLSDEFAKFIWDGIDRGMQALTQFFVDVFTVAQAWVESMIVIVEGYWEAFVEGAKATYDYVREAGAAILRGEVPEDIQTFMVRVAVKASETMAEASKKALKVYNDVAGKVIEGVTSATKQLVSDFNRGASDLNFMNTARDIINEARQEWKSPLEGFKLSVDGPQFKMDEAAPVVPIETKIAGKDAIADVKDEIDDLRDKTRSPFTVRFNTVGVEGVVAGSMAALEAALQAANPMAVVNEPAKAAPEDIMKQAGEPVANAEQQKQVQENVANMQAPAVQVQQNVEDANRTVAMNNFNAQLAANARQQAIDTPMSIPGLAGQFTISMPAQQTIPVDTVTTKPITNGDTSTEAQADRAIEKLAESSDKQQAAQSELAEQQNEQLSVLIDIRDGIQALVKKELVEVRRGGSLS